MSEPYFAMPGVVLYGGASELILPTLLENSVDSCVTDPPYELTQAKRTKPAPFVEGSPYSRHRVGVNGDNRPTGGFMGKEWDGTGIAFKVDLWAAVLRVLKPGAHLLAFGGTRTHHRMVCAIEDAGFEIRDEIDWIFGQGFPKSLNFDGEWDGWGTALKPAKEPICLARKPLLGTVAANLARFGTGAINIDGCRVDGEGGVMWTGPRGGIWKTDADADLVANPKGRWPANIIHDGSPEVLAAFPDAAGQLAEAKLGGVKVNNVYGDYGDYGGNHTEYPEPRIDGSTSAGRFFYCPKATKADREEGCDNLPEQTAAENVDRDSDSAGMNSPRAGAGRTSGRRNHHPTVKPTALMRYLCRLITPPNGTVIDSFMGSGSTGKAARLEGFDFIGIEKDIAAYGEIAKARILAAQPPVMEVDFGD